jgi:hypothetical protein
VIVTYEAIRTDGTRRLAGIEPLTDALVSG